MNKMIELNDKILKDYLLGKCTEEETMHILKWIRESDEHAAQLFKTEQLYHLGRFEEYTKKTEKAENHLMAKIKMIENKKSHRSQMMRWIKYAAIAVIVVLIGNGYWNNHHHYLPEMITTQALNKVQQITLPDGSKVWLNRTATLKYPKNFKSNKREVQLEGEAYFEVTKNPHQPFIVSSKAMSVKVLGTVFDYNTKSEANKEEVSLLEGMIQVIGHKEEGKVTIMPGQKVILDKQNHRMIVQQVNADLEAVWHNNMIPLKNANINDIVRILERFYNVHITVDSNFDKSMTYSGVIKRNNTIDSVLSALSYAIPIRYTIAGSYIHLANKH